MLAESSNNTLQASKDDLKALMEANISSNGIYSWRKKIDFTMKHKDVANMIARLDQSNLTLSGFISDSDMLERLQTQSSDKLQIFNLATKLQSIRMHAESLYEALVTARHADCTDSHQIALHLEDRLSQTNAHASLKTEVNFNIAVAIDVHTSPQWYQTFITVARPHASQQEPLEDLCRAIRRAEHLEHSFHLLNNAISKMKLPKATQPRQVDAMDSTTLAHLLHSRTTLTPKDTTILALKLASSLVQLSATGWLESCWTKDAITFFRLRPNSVCHITAPCISKAFHSSQTTPSCEKSKPVDALFELGVLLLEIGYQRSFESWLADRGLTCVDKSRFARLSYALQWHEESEGHLPIKYRVVIAKCLKCSFDEYEVKWENPQFRQAVCRDVIEPLHQNASIW